MKKVWYLANGETISRDGTIKLTELFDATLTLFEAVLSINNGKFNTSLKTVCPWELATRSGQAGSIRRAHQKPPSEQHSLANPPNTLTTSVANPRTPDVERGMLAKTVGFGMRLSF